MNLKTLLLLSNLILMIGYQISVPAVTDAELEALEKQIEQQEADKIKQVETEKNRKAAQKRKIEAEVKKQAEEKRINEIVEKRLAEEETKRKEDLRISEMEQQRKKELILVLAGEMVSIPGGSFQMGSNDELSSNEMPAHTVTIKPFRLGKHEVTFAQWDRCADEGGCGGYRPDDKGWGRGNRPVINVSWNDAKLYVQWLNKKTGGKFRLPSEAEWEYAERAGTITRFHFGDYSPTFCRYMNVNIGEEAPCRDGEATTATVGQYPPNQFGLHDMLGNVEEWMEDCWHENYSGAPSDGRAWLTGDDCSSRVRRGGSWDTSMWVISSTERTWSNNSLSFRDHDLGFRLAQDM